MNVSQRPGKPLPEIPVLPVYRLQQVFLVFLPEEIYLTVKESLVFRKRNSLPTQFTSTLICKGQFNNKEAKEQNPPQLSLLTYLHKTFYQSLSTFG